MHGSTLVYTMNTYGAPEPSALRAIPSPLGPGPGPPKNHPGPTGPCQEPAKSHPRALRAAQEAPGGPQGPPRGLRAPGGARRPPGPPKNHEKRCTVDEIRLFGRPQEPPGRRQERLRGRPGAPQAGPAKSCQERPRGLHRRALGRPGTGLGMTLEAPRPVQGGKIGLKRLPEGSRRPQEVPPEAPKRLPRSPQSTLGPRQNASTRNTTSMTTTKWQPHAFRQLPCHPLCAQKQIEVAKQTSLQHGSCMPSDSCYANPSAHRNRSK